MIKLLIFTLAVLSSYQVLADDCVPKQIYSALGNSYYYASQPYESSNLENNDAIIMFTTKTACTGAILELTDSAQNNLTVRPWEVVNFTANYSDGAYQNYIHVFYLFNLVHGKEYTYRAVSPSGNKSTTSFLNLPFATVNQKNESTRYLVLGDWDHGNATKPTWDAIKRLINETTYKKFGHIVFLGDMAYDLEDKAGLIGDDYFETLSQSIARFLPLMVIPGNHESSYNYSNFVNRIRAPLWEDSNNHYYSYNTELIHWVTFDFDFYSQNPTLAPEMLQWLAEDLKTANENRDQWPWIIFVNHRPMYCSNPKERDCVENSNKYSQIETILYENSVDLYLSGHVHSYERLLPIYKNQVAAFETKTLDVKYEQIINPKAPIHILDGIGGCSRDGNKTLYPPFDYSVTVDVEMGYGVLNCHNKTHLEYTHFRSVDDKVVDHMVLIKDWKAYSPDMIE